MTKPGLLPACDLVSALSEAHIHIISVNLARLRRGHPSEHRREQTPYHPARRTRRRADPRRAANGAPNRAGSRASHGTDPRAFNTSPHPSRARRRSGPVGELPAFDDVAGGARPTDLAVLLVFIEDRRRRRAGHQPTREKGNGSALHVSQMARSATETQEGQAAEMQLRMSDRSFREPDRVSGSFSLLQDHRGRAGRRSVRF